MDQKLEGQYWSINSLNYPFPPVQRALVSMVRDTFYNVVLTLFIGTSASSSYFRFSA